MHCCFFVSHFLLEVFLIFLALPDTDLLAFQAKAAQRWVSQMSSRKGSSALTTSQRFAQPLASEGKGSVFPIGLSLPKRSAGTGVGLGVLVWVAAAAGVGVEIVILAVLSVGFSLFFFRVGCTGVGVGMVV